MTKTALITGGARGIGYAIAERLGRRGHFLLLLDRLPDALAAATQRLHDQGFTVEGVAGDVTHPETIGDAFRLAAQRAPLRAIAHCAGVSPTLGSAEEIFRVNFGATTHLLDEALRQLPSGAAIVAIASIAGHMSRSFLDAIGDPTDDGALERLLPLSDVPDTAYGISKLAVMELFRRRALEFGRRGIRLNTVSPNITNTPMGKSEIEGHAIILEMVAASPIARVAEPSDIAAAVDFLLGEESSYVTGTDLLVDGGCLTTLGLR